ncbi:hypothetical protein PQX77_021549 [Marasmius sp. AFHP31]|nr:hypothetical protein PQX77_021549 [Marasmius sp. AFHP31]
MSFNMRFVTILPEWPTKPGVEARISKQKGIEVLQRLQTSIHPRYFPKLGAFDGKGNLFSFVRYNLNGGDEISIKFSVPLDADSDARRNPKTVRVVIALVKSLDVSLLKGLWEGSRDSNILDTTSGASSCLNMLNLFVQAQPRRGSNLYKGNSFYVKPMDTGQRFDRDIDPLRLWNGFFQSVRPAINEIIVNVDVTAGVVMPKQSLSEAALRLLGMRDASRLRNLRPQDIRMLRGNLKGLKVSIAIENQPKRRPRAIRDLNSDVGAVEFAGPEGMTTVAEHFERKHGIRIERGTLGVKIGQGEMFPVTVCELETQLYKSKLSPKQVSSLHRFMPSNPRDRLRWIEDGWSRLGHADSEFLKGAGVEINSKPMEIEARILRPRVMGFGGGGPGGEVHSHPLTSQNAGIWDVMNKRLFDPKRIRGLMAVNFTEGRATSTMNRFVHELIGAMKERGMTFDKGKDVPQPVLDAGIGKTVAETLLEFGQLVKPNLVLVFLPPEAEPLYNEVKRFGDVTQGIATQCIRWTDKLFDVPGRDNGNSRGRGRDFGRGGGGRKTNWNQYHNNLILKINGKLGGTNYFALDPTIRMLMDSDAMVIGADVSHPAPGSMMPSIASLVSSLDNKACRYVASVKVQHSRTEIIQDLDEMLNSALKEYFQFNAGPDRKGKPPRAIYIFRDGVSEGEFERVRQAELDVIKTCLDNKYAELNMERPPVTFIIVGKRHHFRFFPNERDKDKTGNCRSGLVVDKRITHPVYQDFYLQSQAGLKGSE